METKRVEVVIICENVSDTMRPSQHRGRTIREAEVNLCPLLVELPRSLQGIIVDLQQDYCPRFENVCSELYRELMVPGLRPTQSKRLVENIVRSIELPIRSLTARNPRERVTSRDVLAVPFVIECYKGSCVDEELQLDSP